MNKYIIAFFVLLLMFICYKQIEFYNDNIPLPEKE